jgi:CRP-like cAMP-binding protein
MPDQNLLLRELPSLVLEKLKPRLRLQNFAPGQVLFAAGDKITNIYFPRSGAVSLVCELAGGQMIETAMIGYDSVVGGGAALDDRDAVYKAIVQIGGTGFALDLDTARHIARESEDFRKAIIRHEQLILAQAQQSAACNATHSVEERLSRWLLRARDLWDGETLPMTQEQLARMIGVQRNAISIVAHALQQAGVLSYSRGQIEITDIEALRNSACECYHAVHAKQAHLFK